MAIQTGGRTSPSVALDPLTAAELRLVISVIEHHIKSSSPNASVWYKFCTLLEPPKADLIPYLDTLAAGGDVKVPPRTAEALVALREHSNEGVVIAHKEYEVRLDSASEATVVSCKDIRKDAHVALDADEMLLAEKLVLEMPEVKEAIERLRLPAHSEIVADPWCYGCDTEKDIPRYIAFMMYWLPLAAMGQPDSNHYSFPLPFTVTITSHDMRFERIEWTPIAEGNYTALDLPDGPSSFPWGVLQRTEYDPDIQEKLGQKKRTDLKALEVIQRDGPSFSVDGWAVQWQKWTLRVGFNYREGLTLHDLRYDGRNVIHRLSFSDMTVPYGDPREPIHRQQAFDLGDVGAGICANQLDLGCDCVGHIHYFSCPLIDSRGKVIEMKNVICMHEQDEGIGWKHTNYRTKVASVTRNRVLVLQTVITVANYEYIFAFKLDQAAGIHIETRATGILNTHLVLPGKTMPHGNIVAPGVYAPYHQHLFSLRIDPAIDGHENTVVEEDSVPMPFDPANPPANNRYGLGYTVQKRVIKKSGVADAAPEKNRVFKIINPNKRNPISGNYVGYKLVPAPSQLIIAHPQSICARRAEFANHHLWVTAHRDGELFSAGQYTQQSRGNASGIRSWVARGDNVENADLVVWHTFGLTHNPRVEDFPVMPVEVQTISLKPNDFFASSPASDVPASTQRENKSVLFVKEDDACCRS